MTSEIDFILSSAPAEAKGKVTVIAESDGVEIHRDIINPSSSKDRSQYARDLKQCNFEQVKRDLIQLANEIETKANEKQSPVEQASPMELLKQMDDGVVADAKDKLKNSNLIQLIVDDIKTIGITGEETNGILLYLVGTSRLLKRPANAIVQGSSAAGKSWLIDRVADLFPSESKIVASSMTPQSLHHMNPGDLRHKFVVAGERSRLENDDRAEATRALREMISNGKLSKLMPEKVGGKITTTLIEQEGPIAFVESTTLANIFNEDLNRCLLIHPDESPEQTRRILMAESTGTTEDAERVQLRHHAIQRLLRPLNVEIPYRLALAELMPHEKVEARRLFPMMLSIIQASALLHQYQRPDLGDSGIQATEDDYAIAYQLVRKPLSEALAGRVSDAVKGYFDFITNANIPKDFCVADLLNCSDNPKGESQTYAIVKELHKANYLVTVEGNHRGKHYRLNDDPVISDVLPTPQKLFGGSEGEPENRKTA